MPGNLITRLQVHIVFEVEIHRVTYFSQFKRLALSRETAAHSCPCLEYYDVSLCTHRVLPRSTRHSQMG